MTFEDGKVAYDQRDAEGFIRLNALRLRTLGQRKRKLKLLEPVIPDRRDAASPESIFADLWLWIPGSRAKARAPE